MCILSNFRSIIFFSSKKFATNQHEEEKKANANQSVCNIFGGEYNCISLSFQKKKCFYDGMKSEANEMTHGRNI